MSQPRQPNQIKYPSLFSKAGLRRYWIYWALWILAMIYTESAWFYTISVRLSEKGFMTPLVGWEYLLYEWMNRVGYINLLVGIWTGTLYFLLTPLIIILPSFIKINPKQQWAPWGIYFLPWLLFPGTFAMFQLWILTVESFFSINP